MPVIFTFFVEEAPIVDPLSDDTIRIIFDAEIVRDARLSEPGAYDIVIVSGTGDSVSVREVLVPQDSMTTTEVILVVDKPTHGTHYRVTATSLNGRDGGLVGGTSDFIGRRTKAEDMIRAMPTHYNTQADSVLRQVLTAIGIQDEIIGGSRDDTFS
jgi:hypothetical protein